MRFCKVVYTLGCIGWFVFPTGHLRGQEDSGPGVLGAEFSDEDRAQLMERLRFMLPANAPAGYVPFEAVDERIYHLELREVVKGEGWEDYLKVGGHAVDDQSQLERVHKRIMNRRPAGGSKVPVKFHVLDSAGNVYALGWFEPQWQYMRSLEIYRTYDLTLEGVKTLFEKTRFDQLIERMEPRRQIGVGYQRFRVVGDERITVFDRFHWEFSIRDPGSKEFVPVAVSATYVARSAEDQRRPPISAKKLAYAVIFLPDDFAATE